MSNTLNKISDFKGSPLLAAIAAIMLVIMSVGLAISCGEETPPPAPSQTKAETRPSTGTGRTSTGFTTTTPSTTSTTPSSSTTVAADTGASGASLWNKVFARKDPFKQLFADTGTSAAGTGGLSSTGTFGTTSTTPSTDTSSTVTGGTSPSTSTDYVNPDEGYSALDSGGSSGTTTPPASTPPASTPPASTPPATTPGVDPGQTGTGVPFPPPPLQ